MRVKTRFAPSPTGHLHIGNIRMALLNYLFAKKNQGEFLLRLDDTDKERSKQEYIDSIFHDLDWLGLKIDDSFKQSSKIEVYDKYLQDLKDEGRVYECYETPEELETKKKILLSRKLPPIYDREMLNLSEAKKNQYIKDGRLPHYRLKLDHDDLSWNDLAKGFIAFSGSNLSDPVIVRADGTYLYMFPSVIDDIDSNITHIIRGDDHISNTATQLQLFKFFKKTPPEFVHLPLISTMDNSGLSKRNNSLSIKNFREDGLLPMSINNYLFFLGQGEDNRIYLNNNDLSNDFDIEKYNKGASKLDLNKLKHLNANIIQKTSLKELSSTGYNNEGLSEDIWLVLRKNIDNIKQIDFWLNVLFGRESYKINNSEIAKIALNKMPELPTTKEIWTNFINDLKKESGLSGKDLFLPLRQALTNLDYGPDLLSIVNLMGNQIVKQRLENNA